MMRKIISSFLLGIAAVNFSFAQEAVEIKGQLGNSEANQLKLYRALGGTTEEIGQFKVKTDGSFRFSFYPDAEGIFVLSADNEQALCKDYLFYFKGGEQLNFNANNAGYRLEGASNSKENQILEKWAQSVAVLKQASCQHEGDFSAETVKANTAIFEKVMSALPDFVKANKSGNKKFDAYLPDLLKWNTTSFILNYLLKSGKEVPSSLQTSRSIVSISSASFGSKAYAVDSYPYGCYLLNQVAMLDLMRQKKDKLEGITLLDEKVKLVKNDTLKGDLLLAYLMQQKGYMDFMEASNAYGKYLLTEDQKKNYRAVELTLSEFKQGDPGFAWSYSDPKDKIINFTDFKGKVVVIDVWATWCGPCIAQVPYLKKLEHEMEGQDVVFVGLSTDKEKDKAKWIETIQEKEMGGVQVLAGQNNKFSTFYKISSIPRFLVFDKKGKLVTAKAPRPSDPALKILIERELKK